MPDCADRWSAQKTRHSLLHQFGVALAKGRFGSRRDMSYHSALVSIRADSRLPADQAAVLWDRTRPRRRPKALRFDGRPQQQNVASRQYFTFSPTADRAVSAEQFHARLRPNNATRLSGKEWLWSAKRA